MIKPILTVTALMILLTGCITAPIAPKKPTKEYIVEQDTTNAWSILNKAAQQNYFVWFQGGTDAFSTEEQDKLMNWIDTNQPQLICLRGTGGAEKFRDLANRRALKVITYLQSQKIDIDMVMLGYDANLRGGRVLISQIPVELASKIKAQAPMLVIKSKL